MTSTKQRGFSLLEMMVTIGISLTLAAVTYVGMRALLFQGHVSVAYDTTLMALRNTRNLAITQSHQYYVNFNPGGFPAGTIQIQYQPPPVGGVAQPIQLVNTYSIPADVSFAVQAGMPAASPDGFGGGVNPIDFESTAQPGVPLNYVVFMPDGSGQDQFGNLVSGVVYLTQPTQSKYTSRAITVWGATGRVRGWRLDSQAGGTWVQQ
jgi:prepilin-type N-terminal cleavage/methylation domain-containing protein